MTLEGQQLGRYRIVLLLGSGGMGDVYLAQDMRIRQQVAIKVIRMEAGLSIDEIEEATRLFQREAQAIVALDHPNILSLFDYGEQRVGDRSIIYMVTPYRPEGSLTQWLHRRTEPLTLQEVAHLVRQAAEALQHAHDRQVIHQDVKPSNFLLRERKGLPPDLLLADFSIARLDALTANISQSVRGTPTYMAPEQWQGRPVFATDQYALAIMTYELLTGHPPFQGNQAQMMYYHLMEPPPPLTHYPQDIGRVLRRALAKRPEQRFSSITAFASAFQRVVQSSQHGDLRAALAISAEESVTGTSRTITLPEGRRLSVMIPPGIQNGHVIRFEGEGNFGSASEQRGALLLTILVKRESKPSPTNPSSGPDSVGETDLTIMTNPSGGARPTPILPITNKSLPERNTGPGVAPSLESNAATAPNPPTPITPLNQSMPFYMSQESTGNPVSASPPALGLNGRDGTKRSWIGVVLIIGVTLVLIVASGIGIGALRKGQAQQTNVFTTPTTGVATVGPDANVATLSAAQANATHTAEVAPTAAAIAANPYPAYLPGRGRLALYDSLKPPGTWQDGATSTSGGSCKYSNGAYHVAQANVGYFFNCYSAQIYTDFAFEVQMTIVQGDCGGMSFRDGNDSGKSYHFEVCQNKDYSLIKYVDFTGNHDSILPAPSPDNSAIHPGLKQSNLLAVVAQGNTITLFINRQQIASIQDNNSTQGYLALAADNQTSATDVIYSDAKVWTF